MTEVRAEQFSGCLIGQCLGDALGFVVEGYPPAGCRAYVDRVLRAGQAGTMGRGGFPFGQYTDDSQLARELLQSYLARREFDPADYARRIAAIFAEGRIVGRGQATTEAAWRLYEGVPWDEAGTPPPAAGNGSAMRAGPVGLFHHDDPQRLVQVAHDQGRITHRDPRCSAGAVAIAGAVALALTTRPIAPAPFLRQLVAWAGQIDGSVAAAIGQLAGWVALRPEEVAEHIAMLAPQLEIYDTWQGISPFVTGSVLWSLYAFLRSPEDYWETICIAIAVGGDVDTTAAMAGAISGAHLGLDALPAPLTQRLTDRGTWGLADLVALAEGCYALRR